MTLALRSPFGLRSKSLFDANIITLGILPSIGKIPKEMMLASKNHWTKNDSSFMEPI